MPQRKRKSTLPAADDELHVLAEEYLAWMQSQNMSEDTVVTFRAYIGYFREWCSKRGLDRPQEITRPILERYQRSLYQYRKSNGEPLTFRTQHVRLRALKGWFRWLTRQNYILHNPASELLLPRLENRLPKYVLTASEAEQVLMQTDIDTAEGLRDRTILETFYSTGMRRMELANLKLHDIDGDRGTVMIRQGKGKKDRLIPIGERALMWTRKYIHEARPQFVMEPDDGTLFLTDAGEMYARVKLTALVRHYLEKSKIGKTGGCHLFRHTVATLMLEGGADVRVIQEMLGHAKLTTTELYTRVSITLLKQVHTATHPAANLKARQELFAALAAEEEEDV